MFILSPCTGFEKEHGDHPAQGANIILRAIHPVTHELHQFAKSHWVAAGVIQQFLRPSFRREALGSRW